MIPTHARPRTLRAALQSILGQSLRPAQIIVVDDLGQESARAVVDEVRTADGPRIEYLDVSAHGVHGGAAYSRNRGAEQAESPVLAFLDDDDVWLPGFLENCLSRLSASTTDLVAADLVLRSGEDDAGSRRSVRVATEASDILAVNPGVTGSNFVMRRASFDRLGGFDPSLPVYNDLDFLVRLLDAGMRYEAIGQVLVAQSTGGPGHLSTRDEQRARGVERYLAKYRDRLSRRQRRTIMREVHVSRHRAGQPLTRGVRLLLLIAVNSSPREILLGLMNQVRRTGRPYS